jgi:integrase
MLNRLHAKGGLKMPRGTARTHVLRATNPYSLAKDIHGIGFKTADQIAQKIGIPVDIRARAFLMLLVIYGLLAGEVIRLHLDDFDWKDELLSVTCSK